MYSMMARTFREQGDGRQAGTCLFRPNFTLRKPLHVAYARDFRVDAEGTIVIINEVR